jgi:hypothetical protein
MPNPRRLYEINSYTYDADTFDCFVIYDNQREKP